MKILYAMLTCQKNKDRCETQKNTWLKNKNNSSDYIYISSENDENDSKIIGYNTPDNYESVGLKWWYFMKNYNFSEYDWILFLDDDIYCFTKRLEEFLSDYNHEEEVCIGEKLTAGVDMYSYYLSDSNKLSYPVDFLAGGGGYLVSKAAIYKIQNFIKSCEEPLWSFHGDVSFGHLIKLCSIKIIDRKDKFGSQHWTNSYNFSQDDNFPNPSRNRLTYHYCSHDDMLKLFNEYDN